MTPGTWITRPGSGVRHLLGMHYSGRWWKPSSRPGMVIWLGACSAGEIEVPDDPEMAPHVSDEDMHLYRPCKRCVMLLKNRTDWYTEILNVAWNDIRRSQPEELVG